MERCLASLLLLLSLQPCPTLRPHCPQPTRLPRPWDSPGKNTGMGCHFLLQCIKVKSESEVTQLCPTLGDPMDCSLPGSSIHGIFQARVLEWGAIAFSLSKLPSINRQLIVWVGSPQIWESINFNRVNSVLFFFFSPRGIEVVGDSHDKKFYKDKRKWKKI